MVILVNNNTHTYRQTREVDQICAQSPKHARCHDQRPVKEVVEEQVENVDVDVCAPPQRVVAPYHEAHEVEDHWWVKRLMVSIHGRENLKRNARRNLQLFRGKYTVSGTS